MTIKAEVPEQNNAQLESIECASIDELRSLQLQRLQWSIKHAYDNSVFYRQKLDRAGVHPDDIQSLDDLAKLPFTEKNDLRDNYQSGSSFSHFAQPSSSHARTWSLGGHVQVAKSST